MDRGSRRRPACCGRATHDRRWRTPLRKKTTPASLLRNQSGPSKEPGAMAEVIAEGIMAQPQSRIQTPAPPPDALPCLVPDMPSALELQPYLRSMEQSGWYTNFGPLVRKFESRLARVLRRRDRRAGAIGVCSTSSGTAALELGLAALNLPPKARVLVPAVAFPSSATAVIRSGYTPLISDVDKDRWILTPAMAEQYLSRLRFEAVMPVAAFGHALDSRAWDEFAAKTAIPVLLNATPAYPDQTIGDRCLVAFSFHATKSLGIGEGGALVARDQLITARAQRLSNFGFSEGQVQMPGTNAKLSEYHAAVGLAQLDRWADIVQRRQAVWKFYEELLQEHLHDKITRQMGKPSSAPSLMVVTIPDIEADRVLDRLVMRGIHGRRWCCPAIHLHPGIQERSEVIADELPVADSLTRHLVGLPFHTRLSKEDVSAVVRKLSAAIEDASE